jgi:hypothetical protein
MARLLLFVEETETCKDRMGPAAEPPQHPLGFVSSRRFSRMALSMTTMVSAPRIQARDAVGPQSGPSPPPVAGHGWRFFLMKGRLLDLAGKDLEGDAHQAQKFLSAGRSGSQNQGFMHV